jgi:hypothetical protein
MGRIVLSLFSAVALLLLTPGTVAARAGESAAVPFAERYHAVQHGGLVRIANSVVTCGDPAVAGAVPCSDARSGARARSADYTMGYVDVDSDPNTYNSSRASLNLPAGSRVSYARLYWGANIRVGEQKPPQDNARILFAEPGGQYREILADSVVGHRNGADDDVFMASADVTEQVRYAEPGAYTVAQINTAAGHSAAGAWGGWTLVVAYENPAEPLRELVLYDGYAPVDVPGGVSVRLDGLRVAPGADARLGFVAGGGDRGVTGDHLTARAAGGRTVQLTGGDGQARDLMNSTIHDVHGPSPAREPDHPATFGYDADVLDAGPALTGGAERLDLRFAAGGDAHHLGAVFLQADALS